MEQSQVPLVVIPCLNEAEHLGALVTQMHAAALRHQGRIVIVDGGSVDGSIEIAQELSERLPNVHLLHNPARLQSAGINAAVKAYGKDHAHLIRVDAHARYPVDFIDTLLTEAEATGAASVTVGMIAEGTGWVQRVAARTQNAKLGNGGSAHRTRGAGAWVDHGHHALMTLAAFEDVGGYDPSFSHNEDAELDHRLTAAGHRIWLTGRTEIGYYPRETLAALTRQYFNYGHGRARNLLKHRSQPRLRQVAMIAVLPALLLAFLAPVWPVFALPALVWGAATLAGGLSLSLTARSAFLLLSVPVAIAMHAGWSAGFWTAVVQRTGRRKRSRPA